MNWIDPDISKAITAPLQSTPQNRSAELLAKVVQQFDVRAARYLARDVTGDGKPETFCNFFTRDVSRAMHAPLPEGMRANQMFTWLDSPEAKTQGWEACDEHVAQRAADEGLFAVAVWQNAEGPGHITPLIPSQGLAGTWVSHVGGHNFSRGTISQAFGHARPRFWVHA